MLICTTISDLLKFYLAPLRRCGRVLGHIFTFDRPPVGCLYLTHSFGVNAREYHQESNRYIAGN